MNAFKLIKSAAYVLVAALVFASCEQEADPGDDTPVVDDAYLALVDSLENVLYKQARAMQVVLTGEDVTISSCAAQQIEGVYDITLSSGASFQIYVDDEELYADALSYVEADGKTYWSVCDKEGNAEPVKDAEGGMYELSASVDVKVVDGKINLKFGDVAYDMGYGLEDKVQMFDCSILEDNGGSVYAVEFDFGEGKTKVVYLSDYTGLYFYLPSDDAKTAISELYVNKSGNASVAVNVPADIAWQPMVDEGWTATVRKEGDLSYVDITAPKQYEITEESQPVLKAGAVDGTFVFATVTLTDVMFSTFTISVTDAVIAPSKGLGKFAYGISLLSDFDGNAMLKLGNSLIAGEASPSTGNGLSEATVSKSFADILGTALDSEERYVLWAVADGVLTQLEFGEISVDIDLLTIGLLDAEVNVKINGAASIYGGVVEKSDDAVGTILYQVTNNIYDPISVDEKFVYNGSAADFPVTGGEKEQLMPSTTYLIWVVPAVGGEYEYSESDIIVKEFTTNSVTAGGSLELTCGDPVVTPSSITFPLSCEGAEMIYYAYLDAAGGSRYASDLATNDMKFEQITGDNDSRVGDYVAVIGNKTDAYGKNLNDEAATEYWLYAVAVDADGKYGKVLCVSATTLALAYDNSISLKVETSDVTASKATVKVTSTGGDLSDYIYWVGRTSDPFWANSAYCNQTPNGAQKYMALNPDDENIQSSMRKYGRLDEKGVIVLDGLTMETSYVFLILEKGETYYSPIGYKLIKTLAADLGTVVKENSDTWNAAKSSIQFDWVKETFEQVPHLGAYFEVNISCPKDLTAYIMCAGDGYYEELKYTKVEHFMIDIENYCSRAMDKDHTVDDGKGGMKTEPDYYKNGVLTSGQLMGVNDFYVHGAALYGSVTYFAENSHGEDNCIAWSAGQCANYQRALEKITYYQSLEPWLKRASSFGLKDKEQEDWAKALHEAYTVYYQNAKPIIYINDGSPLRVVNASATGVNEDGVVPDRIYIMLKDKNGNYYEPMKFEVPNYFEEKTVE